MRIGTWGRIWGSILFVVILGVILVRVSTRSHGEEIALLPQGINIYDEIFETIQKNSFYELSDADIAKIKECMIERAFQQIKIAKDEKLTRNFVLNSCFKQDVHAHYVTALATKLEEESRYDNIHGIGATVEISEDERGAIIKSLVEGGSAIKSGKLRAGDLIIAAGESPDKLEPLANLSLLEMVDKIRGPEGTSAFLEVIRDGKELPVIEIVRAKIQEKNFEIHLIGNDIIYFKIYSFSKDVPVFEVAYKQIAELQNQGATKIVIDLRNNPGGFLHVAADFLERFAPAEGMLVETRDRNGAVDTQYKALGRGEFADLQVAVLVNRFSASASELTSGTLQIWGARVFGEKTYGKGSVQSIFDMPGGGYLAITTMRYYLSNNETPDGMGIMPNEVAPEPSEGFDPALELARQYLEQ